MPPKTTVKGRLRLSGVTVDADGRVHARRQTRLPKKKVLVSMVKRVISQGRENRAIGNQVEKVVLHNSPIGSADCYPIIPDIVKGDDSFQRQGDRITPKSLRVKGLISFSQLLAYGAQKDVYVRVMILSQKNIKTGLQIAAGAVDSAHLLRPNLPLAPQVAYDGTTSVAQYPINTDLFRVYMDKTIKLTGTALSAIEQISRFSARWSYTFKQLPASLTFDEGNGDMPNNFAPFVCVGYSFCDGSPPETATTRILSDTFSLLTYEDA